MDAVTNKRDFSKLSQCHLNPTYQELVVNSFSVFLEMFPLETVLC